MEGSMDKIFKLTIPTPFAVGPVNVYVIKGDTLTLIDTGPNTSEALESLKNQLKEIGYDIHEIEQLVLTHHHPDHVGLIHYFKEIPLLGHWRNNPWLQKEEEFLNHVNAYFSDSYIKMGLPAQEFNYFKHSSQYSAKGKITEILKEGDVLPGLPDWKVIETPGHAQSHIVLYREKDGTMIGGDHIIEHISSNPINEPPYIGEEVRPRPQLQYNDSLRKCLEMEISKIYTGHGTEVVNTQSLILSRLSQQESRAKKVYEMLQEKPQTVFEVCKRLFPKAYKDELSLTLSETMAQLDFLEHQRKVYIQNFEGRWIYQPLKEV